MTAAERLLAQAGGSLLQGVGRVRFQAGGGTQRIDAL